MITLTTLRVGLALWVVTFAIALRQFVDDTLWLLRRSRRDEPGINSEADAEAFVSELRYAGADDTTLTGLPPAVAAVGRASVPAPLSPLAHHEPVELASRLRTSGAVAALPERRVLIAEPVPPIPPFIEGWALGGRVATRIPPVGLDTRTPVFDELIAERRRRVRALRLPTAEMRVVFDRLVEAWRCSHCSDGDCAACPGCSCSCKLPAGVGVAS